MKKILLCAPFTKGDLFVHRFVTPPLGVWRVASFLNKRNHICMVYDQAYPGNELSFEELIKNDKWDIIGFSTQSATQEYDIAKMFKAKELSPNSLLIAGGCGAALNYQFILDKTPIDIVVLAEGEYPMLDLCNDKRWQDIPGIVFRSRARVLTADDYWEISKDLGVVSMHSEEYWKKTARFYDEPDHNEINTFRLFTASHCPMGCKFCVLTLWRQHASGRKVPVVQLTPEQILYLVKKVVFNYKDVKQIFFVTDDFFLVKDHGEKFCEFVIRQKAENLLPKDLAFIALTNIIRVNENNLALMKEAGFRVLSIGVESTSQFILDSLGKKQTEEQIWKATEMIIKAGIKPYFTGLIFTPYCRIEDLVKDLDGFRKLNAMGVGLSLEPYLIPLKGTMLDEERVPESTRWIQIEGTDLRIKKGFAWLPVDYEVRKIFYKFEEIFPKFKAWRFATTEVKHKEKNFQAGIMLDCLEFVLRYYFYIDIKEKRLKQYDWKLHLIKEELENYKNIKAVDTVGDFVEKEEEGWKY